MISNCLEASVFHLEFVGHTNVDGDTTGSIRSIGGVNVGDIRFIPYVLDVLMNLSFPCGHVGIWEPLGHEAIGGVLCVDLGRREHVGEWCEECVKGFEIGEGVKNRG